MLSAARAHPRLAAFTIAYVVGFAAYGAAVGSDATGVYVLFLAALVALVAHLDRRTSFSGGVLWGLSVWGFAHMAGGLVRLRGDQVLYELMLLPLLRYDQAVHAFGFGFATLGCAQIVQRRLIPGRPLPRDAAVLVALMGMGLGAVNEVIEFVTTLVLPATNVGGYANTGADLVFNLLGAAVAAVWISTRTSRRRPLAGSAVGTVAEARLSRADGRSGP